MKQAKVLKRPIMSEKLKGKQFRLGKKMTTEAKKARREKMGDTICAHRRIPVLDLDTSTVYPSISEASNDLGISICKISRALKHHKDLSCGKRIVRFQQESVQVGF